jgi:cytochrome d ubiquinol oxidase subunit II
MAALWFWIVGAMLTVYVVLDGFDIGAGILHMWVARTDTERRMILRSIGPVWDGNEVWLIAAGGTLYFAFPLLYASSFSGFYLPLMMVLWLLILRGISIEFRGHVENPVWTSLWDVVFCLSSILLAVFYGAALGNVVRGVPLDAHGNFFESLWTNFLPGASPGILDWYTILVGVAALASLTLHGALWLARKTDGELNARSRRAASLMWPIVLVLVAAITAASFRLQPLLARGLASHPLGWVFPVLALAGFFGMAWFHRRGDDGRAFYASCAYLAGMLTSAAAGLYPAVLPASGNPSYSLTITNASASPYGLRIGLIWWLLGMALAITWQRLAYRSFAGKVALPKKEEGY